MKTALLLPVLPMVFALTAGAWAGTVVEELEEDSSLETEFVTLHKVWAKGYARGPVRVLFLLQAGGSPGAYVQTDTRMREAVELMQRFDITGDLVIMSGKGFYQQQVGQQRAKRLLENPYDVYVFGNVDFDAVWPELAYKILERVVGGAGLVCVGPKPKEVMTPKRAVAPLPAFLHQGVPFARMAELANTNPDIQNVVSAYQLKQGRGVSLAYAASPLTPDTPFSFRSLTNYDYWMLLLGRAVLWAAAKDSDISFAATPPRLERAAALRIPLDFTAAKSAGRLQLDLALCRSDGARLPLPAAQTAASGKVEVALPPGLRADAYYLDVVARGEKGVETFGACAFEVTSPVGLEAVKTFPPFVERGETLSGSVTLRGQAPQGSLVRVQLRDSYNRILARQDLELNGKAELPFTFEIGDWATILMRAEALLVHDEEEIEMKETSFLVPKRRRNQFNFVQWASPRGSLAYFAWQKLREAGWEVCLGPDFAACQAADISVIPYSTRLLDEKDKDGVMKPCCWNDEAKVARHVAGIVEKQAKSRETGAFVYSLGDEGVTKGCCVHPACLAAYRKYLQSQYGTIQKLNASWGEKYASFDDVDLLDRKENMEQGAIKRNQFARWYDRQAFSRWNLAQFAGRFVKKFKELDPLAITGFEGAGGFGDDYDAILAATTFWSPYPSLGDDVLRGVAPREHIRANWMGYEKKADPLINYAWRMVVKGMDSIWWWRWDGAGSWRGVLRPTLDYWPEVRKLNDDLLPVRQGLGDLLLHATPRHSGIAIFYSLPSALSHQLENGREFLPPEMNHKLWVRATYDVGLDFRYLSSRLLKSGALTTQEFKALLLPITQAIGPEEAQAIRRFAEQGGVVIADVRPGIYDDHCKPETPGVLDDLFGIKRAGRGKGERRPLNLNATLGQTPIALQNDEANMDVHVASTLSSRAGAQALGSSGDTPVLLVNKVGKGQAILLNFEIAAQPRKGEAGAIGEPTKKFVAALYAAAGVRPPITVRAANGGFLDFVEPRLWQTGDTAVIGLWNEMNIRFFAMDGKVPDSVPQDALVTLPAEQFVYDLRQGKALGKVREIRTRLTPGRANFFAAYPCEVRGLKLTVAPNAPAAGRAVEVNVALDTPAPIKGRAAVHLQVLDPNGNPRIWGNRVLILEDGVGRTAYPVAFNDMPGPWKVKAAELFSRATSEATWEVK